MAIHSLRELALLALAGAFGGYTYWMCATTVQAVRAKLRKR